MLFVEMEIAEPTKICGQCQDKHSLPGALCVDCQKHHDFILEKKRKAVELEEVRKHAAPDAGMQQKVHYSFVALSGCVS